jgi:transketolase
MALNGGSMKNIKKARKRYYTIKDILEEIKTVSQNMENLSVSTIWELFSQQSAEYKQEVLPPSQTKRVAIELGISLGWERFVGFEGKILSIETFGASGDGAAVMKEFGFTTDNVVRITKSVLNPS